MIRIYVPKVGRRLGKAPLFKLTRMLCTAFGGYTTYQGMGTYLDEFGDLMQERVTVYESIGPDANDPWQPLLYYLPIFRSEIKQVELLYTITLGYGVWVRRKA